MFGQCFIPTEIVPEQFAPNPYLELIKRKFACGICELPALTYEINVQSTLWLNSAADLQNHLNHIKRMISNIGTPYKNEAGDEKMSNI